jgi:hypothetical protein
MAVSGEGKAPILPDPQSPPLLPEGQRPLRLTWQEIALRLTLSIEPGGLIDLDRGEPDVRPDFVQPY